jgi:cytochrome c peroxidase
MRILAALLFVALAGPVAHGQESVAFSPAETARIFQHGPWPPSWGTDASNRVSGSAAAGSFGEALFFDKRLSAQGEFSCASCHMPELAWTDGRARSRGHGLADRNAPSLLNVRLNRWFGWDGAGDSLWMQSIRPILDGREMAAQSGHVAALIRGDREMSCRYRNAFGVAPPTDDELVLVDVAKALASFQETLISGRAPFDEFRDALAADDKGAMARYPISAQRGLQLFVGRGNCSLCHFGANFTNGEFHDIGIPFFAEPSRVDSGRFDGIRRLQASPFNRLGRYSDDTSGASSLATRHVASQHRNWGEFKVPSLRHVALTAPYMHAGSHATLADVVRHYSDLDENRLHADGERLLKPLRLSADEIADLVTFLETLTPRQRPEITPRVAAENRCP